MCELPHTSLRPTTAPVKKQLLVSRLPHSGKEPWA